MKRVVPIASVAGGLALAALQLVPLEFPRDNPPAEATIAGPAEATLILRRVCFDCHSFETRWPFYA